MITIDGSTGEGGGQVFRTSLTLAMALGKPVLVKNIRAGRKKPGLLRQHLACLRAAKTISSAEVVGDQIGATEVQFSPGKVKAGTYHFSVGTAGSTTLIFQTIFPVLAMQDEVSEVTFEGGTHNGMAPSYDFLRLCFLPAVEKLGLNFDCNIEAYGFYPAGGGRWTTRIYPQQYAKPLDLCRRGTLVNQEAVVTQAKIPFSVADRELEQISKGLEIDEFCLQKHMVNSIGPGNIVSARYVFTEHTEVMEVIGEKGVKAERVAKTLVKHVQNYLCASAPVGEYLADQLIVPMVLSNGGTFHTQCLSSHLTTNIDVVKKFMAVDIHIEGVNKTESQISIKCSC